MYGERWTFVFLHGICPWSFFFCRGKTAFGSGLDAPLLAVCAYREFPSPGMCHPPRHGDVNLRTGLISHVAGVVTCANTPPGCLNLLSSWPGFRRKDIASLISIRRFTLYFVPSISVVPGKVWLLCSAFFFCTLQTPWGMFKPFLAATTVPWPGHRLPILFYPPA